jgi:methylenetetrahydrofolate dehydrogenase (NADP+)/methenyltetrahydrofolate cyclohydrolase
MNQQHPLGFTGLLDTPSPIFYSKQMKLLRGEEIAKNIRLEVASEVERLRSRNVRPKMAAIVASLDAGVLSYVRSKVKTAINLGIELEVINIETTVSQVDLEKRVADVCADPSIHGVILEMPLAQGLNQNGVLDVILPNKDIEGLTCANLGKILAGREIDALLPSTPLACIMLAESFGPLVGKRVGVVGRGKTVGRPIIGMLLNRDATPIICHTRTSNLKSALQDCDIVIVAAGRPKLITDAHVRSGQIVIDAGINYVNGQITGDVDSTLVERAGINVLTPVPGGVGPITSALIFRNLIIAIAQQEKGN